MVISPILCVCISVFSNNTLKLEKNVETLSNHLEDLVTVDESSGFKNIKAYINDAEVYKHIAKRYKTCLALIIFEPRFKKDIERMVGKQRMHGYVMLMVNAIQKSLRNEDEVYILDKENYIFGILLLTNFESKDVIVSRMKEEIDRLDAQKGRSERNFSLDIKVGAAKLDDDSMTALELIEKTKSEIQYDV